MRAFIVVDLGFGDAGKGLLTDYLVRHFNAGVVVRYNGGAQAGHNVVTPDGRHHTFSQFGSGAFSPHVRTFLSRHVVIHPTALLVEGDLLQSKGVPEPFAYLRLSDQALVITPFHQAANHIREIARGPDRHGSCGVGVGEAVEDALLHAENSILAGDLYDPNRLRRKLRIIREQKLEQLNPLRKEAPAREWEIFERGDVIDTWISSTGRIAELGLVVADSVLERWLHDTETAVFEGAQGILLDAEAGFHPYTTWSNCSGENALDLIREMAPHSQAVQTGVMRSYAVRHGAGPLPTETDSLSYLLSEHNQENEWQGAVRYGWFDAVLARYALSVTGRLDALMVTHLDILPKLEAWKYCPGYGNCRNMDETSAGRVASGDILTGFRLPRSLPLEERERFTQALFHVAPVLESCRPDEEAVIQTIESLLGHPVGLVSRGPSAENVEVLRAFGC